MQTRPEAIQIGKKSFQNEGLRERSERFATRLNWTKRDGPAVLLGKRLDADWSQFRSSRAKMCAVADTAVVECGTKKDGNEMLALW